MIDPKVIHAMMSELSVLILLLAACCCLLCQESTLNLSTAVVQQKLPSYCIPTCFFLLFFLRSAATAGQLYVGCCLVEEAKMGKKDEQKGKGGREKENNKVEAPR